jgi:hypothetical protein
MRAVLAPRPRKTVGQDAALQVFGKRLLHAGRRGVLVALTIELAGAREHKPSLQTWLAPASAAQFDAQCDHSSCLFTMRIANLRKHRTNTLRLPHLS